MRHYRIQVVDGTSALDDNHSEESSMNDGEEKPAYWIIRSRHHADSPFFFDTISAGSDTETTAEIALRGRFDSIVVPDLNEALDSALTESPKTVVLDLSEVHFISMEGIFALMEASNKLEFQNVRLLLTGLQPEILKLFMVWNALPGTTVFSSRQEMKNYLTAMQKLVLKSLTVTRNIKG